MGKLLLGAYLLLFFLLDSIAAVLVRPFVEGSLAEDRRHDGRRVFNLESYGAIGDGVSDDTKAFLHAWKAACSVESAILRVTSNKTFLIRPKTFEGPCKPNLSLRVDGTLIAPEDPRQWKTANSWLRFTNQKNFTLGGQGTLQARGRRWWETSCSSVNHKAVCFEESKHIKVKGVKIVNSPHFHLHFLHCNYVNVISVRIKAPSHSPQTDGIHLEHTMHARIKDSVIGVGDDCISVGHGSYNVTIVGLTCGPGHGISVGSLGKGNSGAQVHTIMVHGARINGTNNGLRIKTWQGGYGWARNIIFRNIEMIDVSNPIVIDQYYCDSPEPCPNRTSAVEISDIIFKDIVGTSRTDVAVRLVCSSHVPCKRILLSSISLKPSHGGRIASSYCHNAHGQTEGAVDPPSCLS
ncbi:polygalacturonase-like isoform X2 [Tasmannia lanceolata]|uniref:polygalacturonase-like isoform X2 n=1 Tax=Tasmannia lanceolata TaxID=3420 RepID=UPI0040641207